MKCFLFVALCIIGFYARAVDYHLVFMLDEKEVGRRVISRAQAASFLAVAATVCLGYKSASYFPCEKGYLYLAISVAPKKINSLGEDDASGSDFVAQEWIEVVADSDKITTPLSDQSIIDLFCNSQEV